MCPSHPNSKLCFMALAAPSNQSWQRWEYRSHGICLLTYPLNAASEKYCIRFESNTAIAELQSSGDGLVKNAYDIMSPDDLSQITQGSILKKVLHQVVFIHGKVESTSQTWYRRWTRTDGGKTPAFVMHRVHLPLFQLTRDALSTPLQRWAYFVKHTPSWSDLTPEMQADPAFQQCFASCVPPWRE